MLTLQCKGTESEKFYRVGITIIERRLFTKIQIK